MKHVGPSPSPPTPLAATPASIPRASISLALLPPPSSSLPGCSRRRCPRTASGRGPALSPTHRGGRRPPTHLAAIPAPIPRARISPSPCRRHRPPLSLAVAAARGNKTTFKVAAAEARNEDTPTSASPPPRLLPRPCVRRRRRHGREERGRAAAASPAPRRFVYLSQRCRREERRRRRTVARISSSSPAPWPLRSLRTPRTRGARTRRRLLFPADAADARGDDASAPASPSPLVLKHQKVIEELQEENENFRQILIEECKVSPTKFQCRRRSQKATR